MHMDVEVTAVKRIFTAVFYCVRRGKGCVYMVLWRYENEGDTNP